MNILFFVLCIISAFKWIFLLIYLVLKMATAQEISYDDLELSGYNELLPVIPPEIEHNCIACSPTNPYGIKMRFFGNKAKGEIISRLILKKNYCGFPNFTHGGIITLILDELMAHLLYLLYGRYGVTKSIKVEFLRPVLIGKPFYVRAVLAKPMETELTPDGISEVEVKSSIHAGLNEMGKICASAQASMVILPDERFELLWKSQQ
ncbi:hypothetical protein WKT22_02070 [Candidatus Lokiarchaeum ossiferum]